MLFGPVPARVSAKITLELLGLIDQAGGEGWSHAGACRVLDLAGTRAHHWRARLRETGTLEDGRPGDGAVHGILAWEEQAILDLIEQWGFVDRSHRKLAHRGSYIGTVCVSPRRCCGSRSRTRSFCRASRSAPGRLCLHFPRFHGSATGSGSGTQSATRRSGTVR